MKPLPILLCLVQLSAQGLAVHEILFLEDPSTQDRVSMHSLSRRWRADLLRFRVLRSQGEYLFCVNYSLQS